MVVKPVTTGIEVQIWSEQEVMVTTVVEISEWAEELLIRVVSWWFEWEGEAELEVFNDLE